MTNARQRDRAPVSEHTVRIQGPGPAPGGHPEVDRYLRHFVSLLEANLDVPAHPVQALDLACGGGAGTLALLKLLPAGSRVVALSNDRVELRRFLDGLPAELRGRVYPRKERRDRLPFALNVFDLVWGSLAGERLEPFRPALRQALRVLRPGGQLLIATPLKSTFVELAHAIGPFIGEHRSHPAFPTLMSESPQLLDADGWLSNLRRCGAVDLDVERDSLEVTVAPPLSSQRLFARYLLPLWVGDDPPTQATCAGLLDHAVTEPLKLRIHLGCIRVRRGQVDIEDSLSGP